MKKYKVNSSCSKCGDDKASTKYGEFSFPHPTKPGFSLFKMRIERKCSRCGFVWYELPLDSNEDGQ
jgi:hypothetical protein